MNEELLSMEEPEDYFSGLGIDPLPCPTNVLLFTRETKKALQQEALQNRSHHRLVLAVNFDTEGHVHLDNLMLPFCPGQALLIMPYQFHHFSRLTSNNLQWLFCTFELEPHTVLEPLRNRVVDLNSEASETIDVLLKAWQEKHPDSVQSALQFLLMRLKKDGMASHQEFPPDPEEDLIRTINHTLAEWRGRPLMVSDLAEKTNYSESRLRVLFKEIAGIPLGAYMQNFRLNRAMSLLRTTEFPIAEVAEESGFGSAQAFCRVFKQETGMTPRSYRVR